MCVFSYVLLFCNTKGKCWHLQTNILLFRIQIFMAFNVFNPPVVNLYLEHIDIIVLCKICVLSVNCFTPSKKNATNFKIGIE